LWHSRDIKLSIKGRKRDNDSIYPPGIYINNVAITIEDKEKFEPPVLLDTYRSGIILEDELNQMTYFIETASGFVYYSWGISA
jgi:hypothetical protein